MCVCGLELMLFLLISAFEFPRINYSSCNGRPYRFVYGVAGLDKVYALIMMDVTLLYISAD